MDFVTARLIRHAPHRKNNITATNGDLIMQTIGALDANRRDYDLIASSPEPRAVDSGVNYFGRTRKNQIPADIRRVAEFGAVSTELNEQFLQRARVIAARAGILIEQAILTMDEFPAEKTGHVFYDKLVELVRLLRQGRIAIFSHSPRIELATLVALQDKDEPFNRSLDQLDGYILREGEAIEIDFLNDEARFGVTDVRVIRHPQWALDMMQALKTAATR